MANTSLSHRRTHNLLLISKLISQRDHVSPFTLVLDTLEQVAGPLLKEYIRRARLYKTRTIFLSFESCLQPAGVDVFITCYKKTPTEIYQLVRSSIESDTPKRTLVLVDSLHSLCTQSLHTRPGFNLTAYLSSFLAPPRSSPQGQVSMVAVLHNDVQLSPPSASQVYEPSPLSLLSYLATTIITIRSVSVLLSAKQARERSQAEPAFGLEEEKEGIVIGLKPTRFLRQNSIRSEDSGIVLELEHRRKSGRGLREVFFLPLHPSRSIGETPQTFKEHVTLLDDHPLLQVMKDDGSLMSDQELSGLTFELGLTDRQRAEREGVVLPYFDAQKGGGLTGPGEGGRILYDMGVEDDFDEEEDEI